MSPQALWKAMVSALLPQMGQDGPESERFLRVDGYGNLMTIPSTMTKHAQSRQGSAFYIGNPTVGTGVAGGILAAFANTTAAFVFYNGNSGPLAKSIDLDLIKLLYTVAPATATAFRFAVVLDSASRLPTGGFVKIAGPQATAGQGASALGPVINTSGLQAWAFTGGAFMTVPAPGPQARTVANGGVTGLPVVGTEHTIRFGDIGHTNQGGANGGGTQEGGITIAPGWWCVVHPWWPGNATTGPSFEYGIVYDEK